MIERNDPVEDSYVGNDSSDSFAISFDTWEALDVVAYVNRASDGATFPLVLDTDFSLNNSRNELTLIKVQQGVDGGGDPIYAPDPVRPWISVLGKLATGYSLFIEFNAEGYQPNTFGDLGRNAPVKFGASLDRLAMGLKAVKLLASRALSFSGGAGASSELPPLIGNAGKVLAVNEDEDGIGYGPTTQEIFDARTQAQAAATTATTKAGEASTSANSAATSATQANTAKVDAQTAQAAAETSATNAATSEGNASTSEDEARQWAQYYAFGNVVNLTFADSPYTVDYGTDENTMLLVDSTAGAVVINLPDLGDMPDPEWKVGVARLAGANLVTVTPFSGQTVNLGANLPISTSNFGITFTDQSPTNWRGDFIIFGSFGNGGGSGLPAGGALGDFINKNSALEGDAVWENGTFEGYSARYNSALNLVGLRDALDYIFDFQYLPPQVNLSASGSGTIREKGTNVASSTLTAAVTKRTEDIARIRFFKDGVLINDQDPPSNIGSGNTVYNWTGSFTDNTTFSTTVTDTPTGSNVSSSVNFSFVYPYYYGCRPPGATGAQVGALTKDVIASTATLNRSVTAAGGDVFYFAQPASYPDLTSILDVNNFESIGSWTKTTKSITGLDGTSQSYDVYEFNNVQSANTTSFTFKR